MLQLLEQVQSQLSACQLQLTALQDLAHSQSEENAELHCQVRSLKTQLVHA